MNIIEGIYEQLKRCREVLKWYESVPEGRFGAAMIKKTIAEAESAISHGDTVEMIRQYQALKEIN